MDIADLIIFLIEIIFSLILIGGFVYAVTMAFGWKGFLLSVCGLAFVLFCIFGFEKFLEWAIESAPALILIFLAAMAVFLIVVTIIALKQQFGTSKEGINMRNKYIKESFKQVFFALLGGFIIFGIIFLLVISSEF
ncbi:hypothetical protein IJ843_01730 [bacterium]|nr:hypothetical protein [bacterium]